jgi:hypothetical protein
VAFSSKRCPTHGGSEQTAERTGAPEARRHTSSGLRRSKLALPGGWLAGLPEARVVSGLGIPVDP